MAFAAEAQIVREIGKFLMNGGLYRGAKPVMWSVVEQTALAEAEIEYHDHTLDDGVGAVPDRHAPALPALAGAAVVIWTTTPWTLPGNRAIAYGAELDYAAMRVDRVAEGSRARPDETLLVAALARRRDRRRRRASRPIRCWRAFPAPRSPARSPAIRFTARATSSTCRCSPASFVEPTGAPGFVHIAPGHGADDFELGQANGIAGAGDGRTATASICRTCRCSPAARSIGRTARPATPTRR